MTRAFALLLLSSVAYAETGQAPPPPPEQTPPATTPPLGQTATTPPLGQTATTDQRAQPPPPPAPRPSHTPYQLRLDVDISLLVLGAALWGGTSFIGGGEAPPPWCGTMSTPPCDRGSVNALDRLGFDLLDPKAALAANVMAGIVPGAMAILDVVDAGITHWRAWLADGVVIAEAVLWSGAAQDIVRRAVRRPRPYMYTPGLNASKRESAEASFSFFSGHTSNTFAMVTAAAYTFSLRHPHSKWQWLVWSLAMAGATTEPILRVLAGDHFPTDCIVGAVVGSASGILFPALHRKRLPVSLSSSTGPNGTMVSVSGRF